jgi:hypothetical protein
MNKKEKELRKNAEITNITEVIEDAMDWRVRKCVVSGYKWEITRNLDNKPSWVCFYNEDYTDVFNIHLSTLFDRCLKEYKVHLEEVERDEKRKVLEEIRDKKEKLLDEKLDELIESYEIFIKQVIKDELHDRMTNEENENFDEELKFILKDIREVMDSSNGYGDSYFRNGRGIHLGIGSPKQNSFFISPIWYLENYQKFKEIILTFCPDYKPPSSPVYENEHGYKFMNLRNRNKEGSFNCSHDDYYHHYWDKETMYGFYDKLILLHRKMKKSKIGYWKS